VTSPFHPLRLTLAIGAGLALAACGSSPPPGALDGPPSAQLTLNANRVRAPESVVANRYLWAATLDVLSFLPIESADPSTGVIVTGFGTPPGGGTAYRATVYISDPALDARALNLALATARGPVSQETARAVEDAILSRARQLRIADRGL
jgi:hypothetical protein